MSETKLQIHVALHYIGAVAHVEGGIGVPSRAGSFIEALATRTRHVSVVAYEPPTDPGFDDGVEFVVRAPNVSVVSLGPKGSWRDHRPRRRRVARIIERESPTWDVLLFYFLPNRRARLVYAANRCERVVAFIVGTTAIGALARGTSVARRAVLVLSRVWTALQMRAVAARSGLVVVNSEELRRSLPVSATNVRTVMLAARRRTQEFRAQDRCRGEHVNVMVAGRMTLEKGVMDAVDAFASLKKRVAHAKLHLAGDGPSLPEMLVRAAEHGVQDDVVVHGWVPAGDALFSLMRDMDIFLMPSYAAYEGFPQVIWEAMAHSVLVVCTPVRGPREILEHEQQVLFVPMREPKQMADTMKRLVDDETLRRRMLDEGFRVAMTVNVDTTVESILEGIGETWPMLVAAEPCESD